MSAMSAAEESKDAGRFRLSRGDVENTEDIRTLLQAYFPADGRQWDTEHRQARQRIALNITLTLDSRVKELFKSLRSEISLSLPLTSVRQNNLHELEDASYFLQRYYKTDGFLHEKVLAIVGMACSTDAAISFRNGMEAAAVHLDTPDKSAIGSIKESLEASGIRLTDTSGCNRIKMADAIYEAYSFVSVHGAHRVSSGFMVDTFLRLKLGDKTHVDYFKHRMEEDKGTMIRQEHSLEALFRRYFHPDVKVSMAKQWITVTVPKSCVIPNKGADYQVEIDGFNATTVHHFNPGDNVWTFQEQEAPHTLRMYTVCNCNSALKFLIGETKIEPGDTNKGLTAIVPRPVMRRCAPQRDVRPGHQQPRDRLRGVQDRTIGRPQTRGITRVQRRGNTRGQSRGNTRGQGRGNTRGQGRGTTRTQSRGNTRRIVYY